MSRTKGRTRLRVLTIIALLSALVLVYCLTVLLIDRISMNRYENRNAELASMIGSSELFLTADEETGRPVTVNSTGTEAAPDRILDKYIDIYKLNNELVGWISIEGTRINYPVMQSLDDEEFYIDHDFDKTEFRSGVPFADSRCRFDERSSNILIYGHNMKNGTMFADLLKYEDRDFYESHKYIRFDTIHEEGLYEVVSVFRKRVAYKDEDTFRFYNFINAQTDGEFEDYLNNIKKLSLYATDSTAILSDSLLTLATCDHAEEDGRFVVVARRIA